ncbi:MAG: L-seryl-tRNA(Sec) selenium transferase [Candidatus Krumholzibacteriota bacterium]|nr:L-seryl-tRNA(Sec) selenium transferase [Candidatus Krumholzibacteriota bacterium]
MDIQSSLKKLPSVEAVLENDRLREFITPLSRRGVIRIIRENIDHHRKLILRGDGSPAGKNDLFARIVEDTVRSLEEVSDLRQKRVINATGVILHTNLGRALMGEEACAAVREAASGYVDLEMDMSSGQRVNRMRRVIRLLTLLTGAEDALVVNNNAAAVFLAVNTYARKGRVAISRGELVEIGGSFRLPEILSAAAGEVLEIGTTNRTHLEDYARALDEGASLLLKVHTSNYRVVGFTNQVSLKELVELGKSRQVPVIYDQGSGIIYPYASAGIEGEEDIQSLLETGVDMLSFSADKVLGSAQAGILLGGSTPIARLRSNHLSRVLRVDKLSLAALEQVLIHYWRGEFDRLPVWRMMTADIDSLRIRAEHLADRLRSGLGKEGKISVVAGEGSIGGGSFPINPLPSMLIRINLSAGMAEKLSLLLRRSKPAILVRIKGDSLYLDLRTVDEDDVKLIQDGLEEGLRILLGGSDLNG